MSESAKARRAGSPLDTRRSAGVRRCRHGRQAPARESRDARISQRRPSVRCAAVRACAALLLCAGFGSAAVAGDPPVVQRALDNAVLKVSQRLLGTKREGIATVAALPLAGNDEYVTGLLEAAVTDVSHYQLVTRSREEWSSLLGEIEWSADKEDLMDPESLQKLGRIKGADAILYGMVTDRSAGLWGIRGHAKLCAILLEVETFNKWRTPWIVGEAYLTTPEIVERFWLPIAIVVAALVGLALARAVWKRVKKSMRPL